ncbi:HAD family hydrolase [Solicola sp. PLA-1-18]|uniref:HAD family hydrolase n=1 Tax=Solicola sp. PLA-1-18 TaxID=3380532 RepID=UPI003B76037E
MIVTFDLFSALTDSRSGATAALVATGRDADEAGALYDAWDARNKRLQADCTTWESFHDLSLQALGQTYAERGVVGDAPGDLAALWASIGAWPLWPDVADGVAAVAGQARVGLLSNVDDFLVVRTRGHALVDPELALTSERLGAYKPGERIYRLAQQVAADAGHELVHVAASARDVRGALEAGVRTVRLARPGHRVDPDGPVPEHEVEDARDLPGVLASLS